MGIMDKVNEFLPGRHQRDREDERVRGERDDEERQRERDDERYARDRDRARDDVRLSRREREDIGFSQRDSARTLREDFDRWIQRAFENPLSMGRLFDARSGIDIRENERELTARVETPGFGPDEVEVMVSPGRLTVRAEGNRERREEGGGYRMERRSFTRSVSLPREVDLNQIEARMRNGLLTVRIPKIGTREEPSRRVPIQD